jgi:hypothetical protein
MTTLTRKKDESTGKAQHERLRDHQVYDGGIDGGIEAVAVTCQSSDSRLCCRSTPIRSE